jgi:NTP pyrophosphatase (non-canonical NTP hydrolase)
MTYTLEDLLHLMARLRDPQYGCPWDLKQNYASIVPHTLEEAYEVADTIERGDFEHLQGELGDLLFQVVYYSQLAREEGRFEFAVVDSITRKLIRRHPHVFPTGELYAPVDTPSLSEAQVKSRWEEIKAEERAEKSQPEQLSLLDDAGRLPALSRAAKLQNVRPRSVSTGRRCRCWTRSAKSSMKCCRPWPTATPMRWKMKSATCCLLRSTWPATSSKTQNMRCAAPIASSNDVSVLSNRHCATVAAPLKIAP